MRTPATRWEVLGYRVAAQQLDRDVGTLADTAVLDIGVQDTGPDGGLWALVNRGVDVSQLSENDLVTLWTVRGAPHLYRRADLPLIAAAVRPFSDADATKRIFDAAKPLKAAGISATAAVDAVAEAMRSIVTTPMVKGEVSSRLTQRMDAPYLRFCRPCNATHLYEMPFRLAALPAGLELEAGTSPPVLRPIPDFQRAATSSDRFDVIRAYLRLLGPATPKHVADYLDAPVKDVQARWPSDTVSISVDGERRWVLASDVGGLQKSPSVTRLLGPFDLFLQAKDRPLLVEDPARRKVLWPVLGRPGVLLVNGEIAGVWRPRQSGKRLKIHIEPWDRVTVTARRAVEAQAERLATHRQVQLSGIEYAT